VNAGRNQFAPRVSHTDVRSLCPQHVEETERRKIHDAICAQRGHPGEGSRHDEGGENGISAVGVFGFDIEFHADRLIGKVTVTITPGNLAPFASISYELYFRFRNGISPKCNTSQIGTANSAMLIR